MAFASILAVCRHSIRLSYSIEGSGMEDFFACLLIWPQTLAQMAKQVTLEIKAKQVTLEIKVDNQQPEKWVVGPNSDV